MEKLLFRSLVEKYSSNPDPEILKRFLDEMYLCRKRKAQHKFINAYEAAQHFRQRLQEYYVAGSGASSFLTYLLDISKTNPLPAHYFCPSCKKIIWRSAKFGRDLPERSCECGHPMLRDGYGIRKEFFWYNASHLTRIAVESADNIQDLSLWNGFSFQKKLDLWAFYYNCINNRKALCRLEECIEQMTKKPFQFSYRDDIVDYLEDFGLPFFLAFDAADHIRRGKIYHGEKLNNSYYPCFTHAAKKEIKKVQFLYSKAHAIEYLLLSERIYG